MIFAILLVRVQRKARPL